MAPKKPASKSASAVKPEEHAKNGTAKKQEQKGSTESISSKKRKNDANGHTDESKKSQRRSGRSGSSKPSPKQLLSYLLSEEAAELTRPDDEIEDMKKRGSIKTYSSSPMNPFEELLCAIVLSRPISHRLGLRTIRTVLNDPYNFTSAKAVQDAGSEKQHQALWDARTQHKDKTAQQLGQLADVVLKEFTSKGDSNGTELGVIAQECRTDISKAHDRLKSSIKGLGPTGLDIFFRRVQWLWQDIFPFIDGRTVDSLRKFGLPYDPEALEKLIDENWKQLDTQHLAGSEDAQKKRRAFVVILERAIGADLEGKIESVLSHAGA